MPNFSCDTTQGFVTLHDTIQGKWVMIFTMPKNLDPISVSALAAVAKLKFNEENKKLDLEQTYESNTVIVYFKLVNDLNTD